MITDLNWRSPMPRTWWWGELLAEHTDLNVIGD